MFLEFFILFKILLVLTKGEEYDNFDEIAITETCPFQANKFVCNPNTRYAKLDGSCNNLQKPWLGKAFIPFKRYIRPVYDDHANSPRIRSRSGNFLPNPRTLSLLFSMDQSNYEIFYTHLLPIFGQFVAHDLTNSPPSQDSSGKSISCDCSGSKSECISISMPSNEHIMRMSCMRLTRTAPANSFLNCGFSKREQLNTMTSFLDGSQIYGSNEERSNSLRLFQGGLLKSSPGTTSRQFLPLSQAKCSNENIMTFCFMAGEDRTSENLGLAAVQTLFMREHNRIATELSRINPHWNDQTLYMETRKLIIGIYQHIIYKEWLPTTISQDYALKADLLPSPYSGFSDKYKPNTNPTIANEFATAAFRFGHTLVRNNFGRYDGNGNMIAASLNISDIIFKNVQAYNTLTGGIESIFLGLFNEPAAKYDSNLADTLQNHLFEFKLADGSIQALDLFAANINRGRDHGIAPYNHYRQKCGLRFAYNFQDFTDVMSWENVQKLANVYEDVNDVDLYLAGLFENPVSGGVVGPTFACLIANQFKDLKIGDRYFYENGPSKSAFTIDQLNELKKMSLSRLICNDFDVNLIQQNVFKLNSQKILCNQIPRLDLNKWKAY